MTRSQQIAQNEVRKARSWLDSCRTMRDAAEARLRAGADYPERYRLRSDVDAAVVRCKVAYDDWRGWERLARTIR